jgi:hypothetical protein
MRILKGVFDFPELTITPSPASAQSIKLDGVEKIIDYDVSPTGPLTAALVKVTGSTYSIKFWKIGDKNFTDCWIAPEGVVPTAIAFHPLGEELFVIAVKEGKYSILRIEKVNNIWVSKSIFSSADQLIGLVICPRPYIVVSKSDPYAEYYAYRLFFGMKSKNNAFIIASITENGNRFYQAIGPAESMTQLPDAEIPPSEIKADWALPLSFHPAGHEMIWEDQQHNFNVAEYDRSEWGKSRPLCNNMIHGGTITATPNGLGFIHWQKDKPGIGLYLLPTGKEVRQLQEYQFIATPSSVPDGRGIVGLSRVNELLTLSYVPISMPLNDVQNAWMYVRSPEEMGFFQKDFGGFRDNGGDQLYELYDTENYYCGNYDRSSPTRPYLVTTDIFWELFASAYEGIFIVAERDQAIPNFWKFIEAADQYYMKSAIKSGWTSVFSSLNDLHSRKFQNPEVSRIMKTEGILHSDVLRKDFDYSELKPRSHYTSNETMKEYFMAFKYLTTVSDADLYKTEDLNQLPAEVQDYAVKWIETYQGFISPSRSPLVWKSIQTTIPLYNKTPKKDSAVFPLSWGFDNEVLNSTVYHPGMPSEDQVQGPGGFRLLPSGLDLASALGCGFAESLLQEDYLKYPPLKNVIKKLKDNFRSNGKASSNSGNLYDRWITALAVQWADSLSSPNNDLDKNLWHSKRLQTGLASWATLRHATGLVNERSAAECGEGGFEPIILRAPRGYVEPDPNTFTAIAGLFKTIIQYVPKSTEKASDVHESFEEGKGSLYSGIINRLNEMIRTVDEFQAMAEKERMGKELSSEEQENILYIGTIAEHDFLIFKSLSNPDYALSTPDPMPKIADVSGNPEVSYLNAAVGSPLEWDYIIPCFGRHEIVKGSVYSYYEFSSSTLLDDKDWRTKLKDQPFLPWIKPFIIDQKLTYPAGTGY